MPTRFALFGLAVATIASACPAPVSHAAGCYTPALKATVIAPPDSSGKCGYGSVLDRARNVCRQCNPGDNVVRPRPAPTPLGASAAVVCLQACQAGTTWNAQLTQCCPPVLLNQPAGTLTINPNFQMIVPGN